MSKDTHYYNKEGAVYSQKRYPAVDTDYVHFFFKKRRALLMRILKGIESTSSGPLSLLEVGCADGVIIRDIQTRFWQFQKLVGIDVSPAMIEEAKKKSSPFIEFYVRNKEVYGNFDVVVEVGVVNLTDMETEFKFAERNMKEGGYYICSLASKTSLRSRLKIKETDFENHLTFKEYETELRKHFAIVNAHPYGIFIPLIWKVPVLARILQPLAEVLMKPFIKSWFHEKIYLLRKKTPEH